MNGSDYHNLHVSILNFRESPIAKDQALFAKAIILVVPPWRYIGSDSKHGTVSQNNVKYLAKHLDRI